MRFFVLDVMLQRRVWTESDFNTHLLLSPFYLLHINHQTGNDVTASFLNRVKTLEPVYVFLVISVYFCRQLSQNSFSISLAFILALEPLEH